MEEKKKVMHLGISKGDIGRYVFLPGSPERSEKIASYFNNPREIAFHREFRTLKKDVFLKKTSLFTNFRLFNFTISGISCQLKTHQISKTAQRAVFS